VSGAVHIADPGRWEAIHLYSTGPSSLGDAYYALYPPAALTNGAKHAFGISKFTTDVCRHVFRRYLQQLD